MTKLTVNRLVHALDNLASHVDLDQFAPASFSEDHREGVAAFLGRRKPRFEGALNANQTGGMAMMKLKPNCECCDRDLPPESAEARICSFECTFCADCAATVFGGVCPNCSGNFVSRPIRPPAMLAKYPASVERHLREQPCVA